MAKQPMDKPVSIEFANGLSSQVVYVTNATLNTILSEWKKNTRRIVIDYKHSAQDRDVHTWYLDLDGVVSIKPL